MKLHCPLRTIGRALKELLSSEGLQSLMPCNRIILIIIRLCEVREAGKVLSFLSTVLASMAGRAVATACEPNNRLMASSLCNAKTGP